MMKLAHILFSAALFSLAIETNAQAPASPSAKQVDAIFAAVTQEKLPGLAVLVQKNGRTSFEKGYGVRDLRTNTKIDPTTNFRLASFTKQFTAMAIMLLVRDGKLRYDETLAEIFRDFPAYGRTITIRNLLNHTGGLIDYEDLMAAAETSRNSEIWTPERQIHDQEVLRMLEAQSKGKFPPGTSWSYSNSGYVVLGLAVARASGQSYGDFLRARIFLPLHLDHTIVFQKGKNEVANRAFGHSQLVFDHRPETPLFKETDQSPTSATLGDGGIYSNLLDLAKWDDALRNHTLLSADLMEPAFVPARLAEGRPTVWPVEANDDNRHPGKPVSYGFGWFLDPYWGHPRTWHSGTTMGFRTLIERFTADNLTIIILSNRSDLDPEKLADETADLYLNLKPKE
jgi:CubicO group peptidase (beta-lactamase class C family)